MTNAAIDRYDLQLVVDPTKNEFDGLITIFFTESPYSDIVLNAQGLTIEQYQYNTTYENKDKITNKHKFLIDKIKKQLLFQSSLLMLTSNL